MVKISLDAVITDIMEVKKNFFHRIGDGAAAFAKAFKPPKTNAFFSQRTGFLRNLWSYNGEKNLGELGPERDYLLDLPSLRSRGKQFYMDNEVAQMIINAMTEWVICNGLKLESEPNKLVLESEGIEIDLTKFSNLVEARISVLKESNETSYSRMRNLNQEEIRAFTASNNGGGLLVVLRVRNGIVNCEIIDGAHIKHPSNGTDFNPTMLEGGNRIANGIELSPSGEHIAFWVLNHNYQYKRILAKSPSTGMTVAYIYGGKDYSIDSTQTIPALGGLFQTLQQMDDYKTYTLGSAKSQNSIAYQIKTAIGGNEDNPLGDVIAKAQNYDPNSDVPQDNYGKALADKVAVDTGRNAFLLGEGQEIAPLTKNEAELYFEQFWRTLFECVCAAAGMPPNVVLKRFDTSFSSARAAIKDWAHSLLLKRYKHGLGFLQPWYELQLHVDIMLGKISAPGYLKAFNNNDTVILTAYRLARWVGDNVPEIDALKEVEAQRRMLGSSMDHVPLTTAKKATEALNQGNYNNNVTDAGIETKEADTAGLKPEIQQPSSSE